MGAGDGAGMVGEMTEHTHIIGRLTMEACQDCRNWRVNRCGLASTRRYAALVLRGPLVLCGAFERKTMENKEDAE